MRITGFGPTGYRPYSDAERDLLRLALSEGAALTERKVRPGVLAETEAFVTNVHAETVEDFLEIEQIDKSNIAVVGFHGQTVLHKPRVRLTVQIGDGAALARRLDAPVRARMKSSISASPGPVSQAIGSPLST